MIQWTLIAIVCVALAIFFIRRKPTVSSTASSDSVWGKLNEKQIESIQRGFFELCQSEELEQYLSSDELPIQTLKAIQSTANAVADEVQTSPAYVPLVVHQYLDADHMLRVGFRENWVKFMTTRPDLAPRPESYANYINATYFEGKL